MTRARTEADDLLERTAAGDVGAFRELYERTGRLVFGTALRVIGDRGYGEEVAQEVFLEIWRRASRLCRCWSVVRRCRRQKRFQHRFVAWPAAMHWCLATPRGPQMWNGCTGFCCRGCSGCQRRELAACGLGPVSSPL